MVESTVDLTHYIFMQERHSARTLQLVSSFFLLYTKTKGVRVSIYILISGFVAQTIFQKGISPFFDVIVPRNTKLIVPFIDFSLQRPFKVEHHCIIPKKWRSVADISTKGARPMTIDILLYVTEKRTLALGLYKDAWVVVWMPHIFIPFSKEEQIHPMHEFRLLEPLLILCLNYVLQSLLFLQQQFVQVLQLLIVVLLDVAHFLLCFSPEVNLDILIKLRLGHLIEDILQFRHGILEAQVFERDRLVFALDVYLRETLRVIESLNRVHRICKHNYKQSHHI